MESEHFSYKRRAVDVLNKFFNFRMPRLTKRLMSFKCPDEDEKYAKKAVEIIARKLKKSALDDLEKALINPGLPSRCVLVQKNLDDKSGSYAKTPPHVVFCRIWRWPGLKSHHELQSIDCCKYPVRAMQNEFCINPYHYTRLITPSLPPVIIPKATELTSQRVASTSEQIVQQQHEEQQLSAQFLPQNFTVHQEYGDRKLMKNPEQIIMAMFPCLQLEQKNPFWRNDQSNNQYSSDKSTSTNPFLSNSLAVSRATDSQQNLSRFAHSVISSNTATTFSSNSSSGCSSDGTTTSSSSSSSSSSSDCLSGTSFCSTIRGTSVSIVNSTTVKSSIEKDPKGPTETKKKTNQKTNQTTECKATVPFEEQDHWASIAYYELNARVGESYFCKHPVVVVDGYTSPNEPESANRLSLGTFSSICRNPAIDHTRQHIGKGIHLHHVSNGIVLQVFSHSPVFVQSRICNYLHGLHYNTVCKILPGGSLKIFDFMVFANLLSNCVHHGFEAVYELTKMCTIRISFAKGWGADYHRQDVTSTPCWIEIHVYGALKWLDNVLTQMDRPASRISSVS